MDEVVGNNKRLSCYRGNVNKIQAENFLKSNENKEVFNGLKNVFIKEAFIESHLNEGNVIIVDILDDGHVLVEREKDIIIFIVNIIEILEKKGNVNSFLNINEESFLFKAIKRIIEVIVGIDFL